jgi:DNA polymerase III psi subunit
LCLKDQNDKVYLLIKSGITKMAKEDVAKYLKTYEVYLRGNPEDLKKLFEEGQPLNNLSKAIQDSIENLKKLQTFGITEFSGDSIYEEKKGLEKLANKFTNLNRDLQDKEKDPKESIKKFTNFEDNSKSTDKSFSDFIKELIYTIFPNVYEKDKNKVEQVIKNTLEGMTKSSDKLRNEVKDLEVKISTGLEQHNTIEKMGMDASQSAPIGEVHIKYAASEGISIQDQVIGEEVSPVVYAAAKGMKIDGMNAFEWARENNYIDTSESLVKQAQELYMDKNLSGEEQKNLMEAITLVEAAEKAVKANDPELLKNTLEQHNITEGVMRMDATKITPLHEEHIKYAANQGINIHDQVIGEEVHPVIYAAAKGIKIDGINAFKWTHQNKHIYEPESLVKDVKELYVGKNVKGEERQKLLGNVLKNIKKHVSDSKEVHKPEKVKAESKVRNR